MPPADLTVELAIDPRSAGRARAIVKKAFGAEYDPHVAMLLASEMVTNAIRHAHTSVRLRVRMLTDVIRLEVSDDGAGTPVVQQAHELDAHGRGLALVADLSTHWGVRSMIHGKTVWCELPAHVVERRQGVSTGSSTNYAAGTGPT